jgi:hypothetical protein
MRFQMRAAQIDADPNLTPEQKAQARRQAEMEAWMSIIAVQPRARRPREEMFFGPTATAEEEA